MTEYPPLRADRIAPLTLNIRSLRAQNDGAEISVTVVIGDGENSETRVLLLTTEQYRELSPRKGPITEEDFEALEKAASLCMAMRCGEHLLSYGANSVRTLAAKIARHGFSREDSVAAAQRLQEMGLIDECADVRREVEKCLRKYWGAGRIRSHLWNRGFGEEALDTLPSLLEDVDFPANCATLIRKHYGGIPSDRAEFRRMTASLYRYGYTLSDVKRALSLLKK